jgi:hypothetical protein
VGLVSEVEQYVLWSPHAGAQQRFLAGAAYESLYGGAAGGGKTDALIYGLLRQTNHPQYRGLFLRQSFPQLREVIDRAHALFPQLGADWRATEMRYHFPSGGTIEFGYCETMADTARYQGQEFTCISYDELGQCPDENVWTFLMSRNRTTAEGLYKQMRASANPGGRGHSWLKRRFVDFCPVDGSSVIDPRTGLTRSYVPARVADNPTLMARDPEYVARLRALPDVMRKQLLDGDWNAGAGLYFGELTEDVHLMRGKFALEPWWPVWGSFDWGFAHPFAAGAWTLNDDGQFILIESVHGRRMIPDDIATRVRKSLPKQCFNEVYAGHDCFAKRRAYGGDSPTIADTFLEYDIALTHAALDRVLGWTVMRRLFALPRDDAGNLLPPKFLIVDTPANRKTLANLQSAVSDPDDPEDVLKEDANEQGEGGDDARDMVRYGLSIRAARGTKPVYTRERLFEPDVDDHVLDRTPDVDDASASFSNLPPGF